MTTKIEWCDETWNPITGCTPISEGCQNCYARRMANRLKGRFGYDKDDPFKITYHPNRIDIPYKWKKPRKIFVNSMGDLFIKGVQGEWLESVWNTMFDFHPGLPSDSMTQHIFLILTKRPHNIKVFEKWMNDKGRRVWYPHIWLGVTVENPDNLWRVDELLKISAAVKFISAEPLLDFLDIEKYLWQPETKDGIKRSLIDWVVAGPETGPKARPCPPGAILDLSEQCYENDIPFFDKREKYIVREFPSLLSLAG